MPSCCSAAAYERVFGTEDAQKDARNYRRKGLDLTARRIVEVLTERGVDGRSVLEVGGGIGAIQVELLKAGAASATNVEMSSGYESTAKELLEDVGLNNRVQRYVLDFALKSEAVGSADVVIMHRVICCYPDMEGLVAAAASHARRRLALSFPPDRWWMRLAVGVENLWHRLTRTGFRAYLHPPRAILAVAQSHGFQPVQEHRGLIWETAVLERVS